MRPTALPAVAWVALGANLGDPAATLAAALHALAGTAGIDDCTASPLYRSAPIDSSGPTYVNGVARVRTTLAPLELLDVLQGIEAAHGRERPYRNAPRTLDLDLLLYEDAQGPVSMQTERLVLPHPRMHLRAFVLRPLLDLAPGMRLAQGPAADLLAACAGQDIEPA